MRQEDHPITIFFIISGEVEERTQSENTVSRKKGLKKHTSMYNGLLFLFLDARGVNLRTRRLHWRCRDIREPQSRSLFYNYK